MKSVRLAHWSKDALRTALFMSVFMLIISLLVGGINWLIWGRSWFDKGLAEFILLVFCVTYFTEAINSVHQRLNEVEDAVRSNSGKL
jgi:NhaP-type Na+/H+ or K+/H+ antiporter